ncbi:MAG: site-specific integrase [Blautia sp.]|nr:site-specific integrase [Blautia sp.]
MYFNASAASVAENTVVAPYSLATSSICAISEYEAQHLIDSRIMPYFENMKIKNIDAIKIRKWQNELVNYKDKNGKPFAQTYLRTINTQLSAIMNYAVRYYDLPKNPCRDAGSIGKSRAGEMKIWTREQFEHFIQFEKKPSYRVAFNILFYTGIREGELLALTPADVPKDEEVIDINKSYACVDQREYFLTPKTERSNRRVSIHKSLHKEIRDLIDGMQLEDDERIFYFKRGGLVDEFYRRTADAGLEQIKIHNLRHSHASMLIHMGVPITEISARLGHESPDITLRTYSHLYPGTERNASDKIAALFDDPIDENDVDL